MIFVVVIYSWVYELFVKEDSCKDVLVWLCLYLDCLVGIKIDCYNVLKFEIGRELLKVNIWIDLFIRVCKRGMLRRLVLVGLIDLV